ncbi:MAG: RHS repeat protein [Nitrospira sp.]|nr:RHS repeat protein [Nitrospira sp.]
MGLGTSSLSTFAYDGRNRLLSTTDPLGKIERYTYDGNDNLLTRLTPKNETISFAYDAVNQLLSKTLPGSQITQYNYDLVGNLTTVTDPDSVLAMTYDLANRLTTVKTDGSPNQPAVTLAYSYDLTGNRLSLTDPVQVASYRYDALNRLQSLTQPTTPATRLPNLLATWPGMAVRPIRWAASRAPCNWHHLRAGCPPAGLVFDGVDDYVSIPIRRCSIASAPTPPWMPGSSGDPPRGRSLAFCPARLPS